MFQLSFSVLLFTAFLRSIPFELEESARIDGATTWQTFWKLIFPLLAPMSATVGIFAFLASWNDFMMPSLIIADPALQTLPVRAELFQTQFSNNYNVSFASYLMAMAPAISSTSSPSAGSWTASPRAPSRAEPAGIRARHPPDPPSRHQEASS